MEHPRQQRKFHPVLRIELLGFLKVRTPNDLYRADFELDRATGRFLGV